MTYGRLSADVRELQGIVKGLQLAKNGSAFTDKQTDQINIIANERAETHAKTYADQAFNRLILWAALSAFSGGAAVVLAYLKIRG